MVAKEGTNATNALSVLKVALDNVLSTFYYRKKQSSQLADPHYREVSITFLLSALDKMVYFT